MTPVGKTHRFPCPGCAADLGFDPHDGVLACPYCGRREAIPQSAEQVVERSYEDYLRPREGQLQVMAEGALEVQCEGCGATVTFTPPEVAALCPFCGRQRVAQPRSADPLVAPQAVLPFALTLGAAQDSIRRWLAGLWFAPNALKRVARHETIGGVYLPFWTYDAHTTGHYRGERGDHYYVTETYLQNGRTQSRRVQKTRWSDAQGTVERWHDDVLVAATRAIAPGRLAALGAWDLPSLRPYDPAFLAGFRAQRYQLDMAEGFETAKGWMKERVHEDAKQDIGGDEQRVHDLAVSYSGVTFKHLLLPVYLAAYSFQARTFQVLVNARTGQVEGERPYSVWKIAFFVLFIVALVSIFFLLRDS